MRRMGAPIRFLSIRQTAAASVAVLATQSVIFGLHDASAHLHRRLATKAYPGFPVGRHGLELILGAHLVQRYGATRRRRAVSRGGLAVWQRAVANGGRGNG